MKALIAGQNPVSATHEEADKVLTWCEGRVGWIPRRVPTSSHPCRTPRPSALRAPSLGPIFRRLSRSRAQG
jgi:hypothetical protein